jgi:hypothetical protein
MADQLLESVRQDNMADGAVSRDAAVDSATLGAAGPLEIVGELRDEVNFTAAFTDDAGVNGIRPGDEEAIEPIAAPVAIDPDIYRDYYDIFGAFYLYISYESSLIRDLR